MQLTATDDALCPVMLAPMEGVLDPLMRRLLTSVNHYDLCVTEFVRVVDALLPEHVYYKLSPELLQGGKTASGTPVRVQLLGQHPQYMAENALRAIALGSFGLDLNFGCPAKMVNRSNGGAAMLKDPESIYHVVRAVRDAIGDDVSLSGKIRLGWDSSAHCLEIADAVVQGGANMLTVHGRTRECGYRAEKINWQAIAQIKQHVSIPVIANGEIWQRDDAIRCLEITQCDGIMVGRGALNRPNLGDMIKFDHAQLPWSQVVHLLCEYGQMEVRGDKAKYFPNRIKQWFAYLRKAYDEAQQLWPALRLEHDSEQLVQMLSAAQAMK